MRSKRARASQDSTTSLMAAYTAQITSSDATTGVALVEIYELPE